MSRDVREYSYGILEKGMFIESRLRADSCIMVRCKFQLFFLLLFASAFSSGAQNCIILSKTYGKGEYEQWLKKAGYQEKIVSLYHVSADSVNYWLGRADGFLLTGGEDIFPGRYGRAKDTVDCGDMDVRRDSLEFRILETALKRRIPVFGICRGLQMINVFFGGSLIADIPSSRLGDKVSHRKNGPVMHPVELLSAGRQLGIPWQDSAHVLSNHHQGIRLRGRGLVPLVKSEDGLIEAISSNNRKLPFIMAVQWHPERMDFTNPLSSFFAETFVRACRKKT
jgi:putative glutamine amidotransferase